MIPLLVSTARFDAMRDGVVIARRDAEVLVTRNALEDWFKRKLANEAAVNAALAIEPVLRRAANAIEPDDGTITITQRLLAGAQEAQDAD